VTAPERVVLRPRRLTLVCRSIAVVVVAVFTIVAITLRSAGGAAVFGRADQVAMVLLGLVIAGAVLGFTRARVEADVTGLRVRNALSEKQVPWEVVREVRLDDGQPWASLELQDDDTLGLLAVQANDGERAVRAVLALRALHKASREQAGPPAAP